MSCMLKGWDRLVVGRVVAAGLVFGRAIVALVCWLGGLEHEPTAPLCGHCGRPAMDRDHTTTHLARGGLLIVCGGQKKARRGAGL